MSITSKGKKACVILDNNQVVTKILVLQEVWELEGDMLLKFAVDVKKGTTLFMIDNSTEVTANDDYKAGDYLYFSKGTFHPTTFRFAIQSNVFCNYYSEIYMLKDFDFSNVKSMWIFTYNMPLLTKLDVSHLDTSNINNMNSSFRSISVKKLELSNFDTKNVTNMFYMFYNCSSLTSLDVSGFDTSSVTNMCGMFNSCHSLTSLDVSNFDLGIATDISHMFDRCRSLTNLIFGSKWGTQTSTAADALTLDLSYLGSSKSYKLTDETYNSMLTMYDRASNGLTTMTIKFSTKHNLPDGFAEKMSALGYTITLV